MAKHKIAQCWWNIKQPWHYTDDKEMKVKSRMNKDEDTCAKLNIVTWKRVGKWRYGLPFLTPALDGGECSASSSGRFTLGGRDTVHFGLLLGWPQSRSGVCGVEKNPFPLAGNRTPVVQPVTIRYTDCAIPGHIRDEGYWILIHISAWPNR
jgi:hypothetical protein